MSNLGFTLDLVNFFSEHKYIFEEECDRNPIYNLVNYMRKYTLILALRKYLNLKH